MRPGRFAVAFLLLPLFFVTILGWTIEIPGYRVADYNAEYASRFAVDSFKDHGSGAFELVPGWGGLLGPDYLRPVNADVAGEAVVISLTDGEVYLNGRRLVDETGEPFGENDLFMALQFTRTWDLGWVTLSPEYYSKFGTIIEEVDIMRHSSALQYSPLLFSSFIELDFAPNDPNLYEHFPILAESWHIDPGIVELSASGENLLLDVEYTLRFYLSFGGTELQHDGYTGEDYAADLRSHPEFGRAFRQYDRLNGLTALLRYIGGIDSRKSYDMVMNGGDEIVNRKILDQIHYQFEPRDSKEHLMHPLIPNSQYYDIIMSSDTLRRNLGWILKEKDELRFRLLLAGFRKRLAQYE